MKGGQIIHHVDASWNETWTGSDQIRNYKFDGDRLSLATAPSPKFRDASSSSRSRRAALLSLCRVWQSPRSPDCETRPGRQAWNPAATGIGRIDGVAKVTGAKLYASDAPPTSRTGRRAHRMPCSFGLRTRGVAGDLQFDRRVGAGLPGQFGKRNADVRCQIWIAVPDRKWLCPDYFEARHTSGICGVPKARASPATVESGEPANSNRPCHPIPPVSPSCRLSYRSKLSRPRPNHSSGH